MKTAEEIYNKRFEEWIIGKNGGWKEAMIGMMEEYAQQKWISTEDKMPERGKGVLIFLSSGFITVGFRKEKETAWQVFGDLKTFDVNQDDEVTHWMSLPNSPTNNQ